MNINQMKHLFSKLRQWRFSLEKQVENIGNMLPACLILRYRARGTKDFQSLKKEVEPGGKSYAYLTYLKDGITRHRYIRKDMIGDISKLTENYRVYCEKIARVRSLNRRIVELLDQMSGIKMEEVKNYVKRRTKRIRGKKRTK